jgi:hypothetical protein
MPLATTATQIELMKRTWEQTTGAQMQEVLRKLNEQLFEWLVRKLIPRRPHTDDMMQMLADMGIEVPDRNFTSPSGLTFYWSPNEPR